MQGDQLAGSADDAKAEIQDAKNPLADDVREIQDQLEKLQQQQIDTDALKVRVAMNESALKELAIACDDVGERSDRQIRGVLYQVENPEFKRNINKMLNYPAQGTYADW